MVLTVNTIIGSAHQGMPSGFWPEMEHFDFGQSAYHQKGNEKRSRMV